MKELIESILNKNHVNANRFLNEELFALVHDHLVEMKKQTLAKLSEGTLTPLDEILNESRWSEKQANKREMEKRRKKAGGQSSSMTPERAEELRRKEEERKEKRAGYSKNKGDDTPADTPNTSKSMETIKNKAKEASKTVGERESYPTYSPAGSPEDFPHPGHYHNSMAQQHLQAMIQHGDHLDEHWRAVRAGVEKYDKRILFHHGEEAIRHGINAMDHFRAYSKDPGHKVSDSVPAAPFESNVYRVLKSLLYKHPGLKGEDDLLSVMNRMNFKHNPADNLNEEAGGDAEHEIVKKADGSLVIVNAEGKERPYKSGEPEI